MAGILVSPGFDQAVRKRNSIFKQRGKSPSFKEILRERCKERFKARRRSLLNGMRHLPPGDEMKQVIRSMVKEEANLLQNGHASSFTREENDMELDIQPLDRVGFDNLEAVLLEEYDRIVKEELDLGVSLLDQLICPLCLSSPLVQESLGHCTTSVLSTCKSCGVILPAIDYLSPALESASQKHSLVSCDASPSYFVAENSLYLFCSECNSMISVAEITV